MSISTQWRAVPCSRLIRSDGQRCKRRRHVPICWALAFWACAPAWAATDSPSAAKVFKNRCASCHGADGENPRLLRVFPDLPDFKDPNWQKVHTTTALKHVILHGGKDGMPGFEDDLDGVTAEQMVRYLRQFAPNRRKSPSGKAPAPPTPAEFYHDFCARCHGADGKNPQLHAVFPALPDFTSRNWQTSHPKSEMTKVILHGGTEGMPAFEGDLEGLDLSKLVRYLRAFARENEELNEEQMQEEKKGE